MERLPRILVHLEGLAVAVAGLVVYFDRGYGWALLLVLALAPDLSAAGYLGGPRIGALSYDLAHTYVAPIALGTAGILASSELATQLALIWAVHIGADRALGYGLKYPEGFRSTHMQRL